MIGIDLVPERLARARAHGMTSPRIGCLLAEAPHAYEIFQKKEDGAFKILLAP